jgi:hypothetical protein
VHSARRQCFFCAADCPPQEGRRFQSALRGGLTAPGRGAGPSPDKNRIDHVAGDAASEGILLARVKAAEH